MGQVCSRRKRGSPRNYELVPQDLDSNASTDFQPQQKTPDHDSDQKPKESVVPQPPNVEQYFLSQLEIDSRLINLGNLSVENTINLMLLDVDRFKAEIVFLIQSNPSIDVWSIKFPIYFDFYRNFYPCFCT